MDILKSIGHYFKNTDLYLLGLALVCSCYGMVLIYSATLNPVSWQDGRCVITPVDIRDRTAIETLLAVNAGDLPWCIAEGTP